MRSLEEFIREFPDGIPEIDDMAEVQRLKVELEKVPD